MLFLCPLSLFGQNWDYPIKPGTVEWKKMNYKKKVKLSQPNPNLIKSLSTIELMSYCLDYPFNKDILLFNNPNDGFRVVFESSTVWQEFIKREDAKKVFVYFYKKHSLDDLFKTNNINMRNHELFNQYFLEKIASETSFITQLNASDKKNLMSVLLDKHKAKKKYPNEYYGFAYNSSLSVIIKILKSENIESKSISNFKITTHNERHVNTELDEKIVNSAQEFLKK